jgi:hypothetical protein
LQEAAKVESNGCSRCQCALEPDDLRCPVCGLATAPARRDAAEAQVVIVRCESCRASITYSAEEQAPKCGYCGSVMRVETPEDPVEQAQAYLPFTVSPDDARKALGRFLARKSWFRPADLAARSTLDAMKAIWWPAWVFNAKALVSWTADSDAGAGRAAWAPHSGQTSYVFRDVVVSASRGLTAKECEALAPDYALSMAAESPRGPAEATVERFDTARSGARKLVVEAIEKEASQRVAKAEVPGSKIRKLKVAIRLTGLETVRYALPAYVLAYRYKQRLYRVVVHGQKAETVIGKAPYSAWRIGAAILAGALAVGAAIAAAVLATRSACGVGSGGCVGRLKWRPAPQTPDIWGRRQCLEVPRPRYPERSLPRNEPRRRLDGGASAPPTRVGR